MHLHMTFVFDSSERLGEEILAHDAEEEDLTKSISDLTDARNLKRNAADGVLLRVVGCCSTMCCVLQRVAVQCVAVCCSVLQCVAVSCSVLQSVAVCSDYERSDECAQIQAQRHWWCCVLQRVATCCSVV